MHLRPLLVSASALVLLGAVLGTGCQPGGEAQNAPSTPAPAAGSTGAGDGTYASVQPVLQCCSGCHGDGGKSGVDLRTLESTLKGGAAGPIVVPGDPAGSVLVQVLRGQNGKKLMPPKGALPEAQIAKVEAWIKAGAKA